MNFGQNYMRKFLNLGQSVLLCFFIFFVIFVSRADAIETPEQTTPNQPLQSSPLKDIQGILVFAGSVSTETGESYDYFLQVKRQANDLTSITYLMDAQTKTMVFMENGQAQLTAESAEDEWTIGHSFLRYNPINRSWILGLDKGNQLGFNLKLDMLNQPNQLSEPQILSQGLKVRMIRTGQVNGSIQFKEDSPALFVSGKNAWFRQLMLNEAHLPLPEIQGLLCRFDDGSQLYAMSLDKTKTLSNSFSAWLSPEGKNLALSQSIEVKHQAQGDWIIHLPHRKLSLELNELLKYQSLSMGYMKSKTQPGFCVISQDHWA